MFTGYVFSLPIGQAVLGRKQELGYKKICANCFCKKKGCCGESDSNHKGVY